LKNWKVYNEAPAKIVGMPKDEAIRYLSDNDCSPWNISNEDGETKIIPMNVQILLRIEKGIVVGASLDGEIYGNY